LPSLACWQSTHSSAYGISSSRLAVPAGRDRLRHLGQRLRVLVAADRGPVVPARFELDVAGGQDLRLEIEQAFAVTFGAG
jgi:hypothetical protein